MATIDERLERAIAALRRHETDHVELRAHIAEVLRRHVGFDVAVVATVDPTTAMWTHCLLDGMERDEVLEAAIFDNEYREHDLLKLGDLLHLRSHAGSLLVAAAGDSRASRRLHEIYRPAGFADELRVLLVDNATPWGAVVLLRATSPFTPEETAALARVGPDLAAALRRSLLHAAVERPGALQLPPGLLICRPDGSIAEMSDEARRLLDGSGIDHVPQVVAAVRAKRAAGDRGDAALATTDGRWVAFHATSIGERDVVIVEQARAQRLADLIVRSRGLSPREREVVELVARGSSTKEIAGALFISEWTVQDHLKSIFAKFGVRTRQELVAAMFFDHYGPRHDAGDTPSPYGWYLEGRDEPARPDSRTSVPEAERA